jgi:hypothetical protein
MNDSFESSVGAGSSFDSVSAIWRLQVSNVRLDRGAFGIGKPGAESDRVQRQCAAWASLPGLAGRWCSRGIGAKISEMLRRVVHAVAASVVVISTAPGLAGPDNVAPIVVDVDAREAVFAGVVAVGVTRPAQRLEIVLAGRPQADAPARARMTAALLALARGTLPRATVDPFPAPAASAAPERIFGESTAPGVRIRMPIPATDEDVRDGVSRILVAVNSRRYGDDTIGARVISIDKTFAGCTPFDAPARNAARSRVEQLSQAIGTPSPPGLTLQRLPAPHLFEAPAEGMPHCAGGVAILPDASLPSSASYSGQQAFAFAQPIRFAVAAAVSPAHDVLPVWSGPTEGPQLRLRSPGVLLTVEGNAAFERRPAGTLYTYLGPNGRWFTGDITLETLDAIRRRLRAAGLPESAIVAQLNPGDGRWYVQVRSPDVRRNDAIAAAISGGVKSERDAIRTTAFGDTFAEENHALERAVADARARAQRIATGLGASIDLAPIAVRTESGFVSCTDRGLEFEPPAPLAKHISGVLPWRELVSDEAVTAFAVFRVGHPHFSGAVRSHVASDNAASLAARFGYVAPPIDYRDAAREGDARLETRLRPQRVRVEMTLSPDNAHGFAAIDPGLAAGLAATLGASAADYTAAFVPDDDRGTGTPTPDQMTFAAEIPNHGAGTEDALNAALESSLGAGYGGFSITPESNGCAAVDDELALDAIRAAARNTTPSERTGRVIAIDLRGPFIVDGACGSTNNGVATWAIRNATVKDVRLAAYARVTYGH